MRWLSVNKFNWFEEKLTLVPGNIEIKYPHPLSFSGHTGAEASLFSYGSIIYKFTKVFEYLLSMHMKINRGVEKNLPTLFI